jgi:hypothetical protein
MYYIGGYMHNCAKRKTIQKYKNRHVRILSLVALIVLAACVLPVEAKPTHLAQKIQDHVMLVAAVVPEEDEPCSGISFSGFDLFRVFPDGTKSPTPFRVPSGKILVITDVEWSVDGLQLMPLVTGSMAELRFRIGDGPLVFQSSVVVQAESRIAGKNEYLATGILVGENALICPEAILWEGVNSLDPSIRILILRGYLINAAQQ